MAQGDVSVTILAADTAAIDAWITAARVTANDKWLMTSIANGQQIVVVHIEEA